MRKTLLALSVAAAAAVSSQASAQTYYGDPYYGPRYAAPVIGAATGTVFGLGLTEGWWGTNGAGSFAGTTWPTSAAGAATAGFVVGVGPPR